MRIAAIMRHAEPERPAPGGTRTLAAGERAALSELGRRQCEAARAWLQGLAPVRVVASPFVRTVETARLVGAPVEPELSEDFAGMRLGAWEQAPAAQALESLPRLIAGELDPPPGGESIRELGERVARAFEAAIEADGNVLIVAHRVVNAVVLAPYLGLAPEDALRVPQDHAAISLLSLDDSRDQVLALNVTPLAPLRLGRPQLEVL